MSLFSPHVHTEHKALNICKCKKQSSETEELRRDDARHLQLLTDANTLQTLWSVSPGLTTFLLSLFSFQKRCQNRDGRSHFDSGQTSVDYSSKIGLIFIPFSIYGCIEYLLRKFHRNQTIFATFTNNLN